MWSASLGKSSHQRFWMQIIMIIPHALTHRRSKEKYSLETELRLAIHADSVGMANIADHSCS